MARDRTLGPGNADPAQLALYERLARGPRAAGARPSPLVGPDGRLAGPFNTLLLQPDLGTALQELGASVRYRTGLPPRAREIAILVVAASTQSAYEARIHRHAARELGIPESQLEALSRGESPDLADPEEHAVWCAVSALTRVEDLDDDTWEMLSDHLSQAQIFELVTLVGYYRLLAQLMRVFRNGD